jgi:hypothetical protein
MIGGIKPGSGRGRGRGGWGAYHGDDGMRVWSDAGCKTVCVPASECYMFDWEGAPGASPRSVSGPVAGADNGAGAGGSEEWSGIGLGSTSTSYG